MVSETEMAGTSLAGSIPALAMLLSICLSTCLGCSLGCHIYLQSFCAGLVITAIMSELYPIIDYYHGEELQNRYYALLAMTIGFASGLVVMLIFHKFASSGGSQPPAPNANNPDIRVEPAQIFVTGANRKSVKDDMSQIKEALDNYCKTLQDGNGDRAVIDLQTRVLEASIAKLRRSVQGHNKFLTASYQNRLGSHLSVLKQYLKAFEDDLVNIPSEHSATGDESVSIIRAPNVDYFTRLFENIEAVIFSLRQLADGRDNSAQYGNFWLRPPLSRIYPDPRSRLTGPNPNWGIAWTMNSSRTSTFNKKSTVTGEANFLRPSKQKGAIAPDNTPNESPRSSTYQFQSGDNAAIHRSPYRSIAGASERTPLFLSTDNQRLGKTPRSYIVAVLMDTFLDGYLIGITYVANQRAGYILAAATCLEMFSIGLLYSLELRSGLWLGSNEHDLDDRRVEEHRAWQRRGDDSRKAPGTTTLIALLLAPPLAVIAGSMVGCSIGAAVKDDHPYLFIGFVCFGIVSIIFFVMHELLISVMANTPDRGFAISMWLFVGVWIMWTVDKLIPLEDDDPCQHDR